ncbi:LPS-assembly protein LptD [Parahaliea aestuarii]|uniref:LPS-assembly protein LptD n=1 Tax=Parahaliea aestuarii TaxID=1852021 RepID=A0A5C8ZNW3_9GAMM|nr:LPS-assembly protein LptD [Parahaliea aestuarii]
MTTAPPTAESTPVSSPLFAKRQRLALALSLALPVLAQAAQESAAEPCPAGDQALCSTDVPPAANAYPLDWVPIREVPEELQDEECRSCRGRYIDPLAGADTGVDPELSDINASAAQTELEGDEVFLHGGVSVEQGYRRLKGKDAYYNRSESRGKLTGGITIREPGILLKGQEASFSSDTGEAEITESQFVLHQQHMRGAARSLRRDAQGLVHVENGALSYCAPGEQDWEIRADEMELDLDEGLGTARGAKVAVGGMPVLYLPWLRFPLDDRRRSGLLWPDIGSDTRGGIDIAAPIYLNLAPNYDALYTPRYIEERGVNNEVELRYLNPAVGSWSVGGAYMETDKRYEDERPEQRDHSRWLGKVEHNGLFGQRWRSRVDYSKASDVDYLKDLQTTNLETRRETSLLQLGSLDYLGDDWLFDLDFQQFQSLADDINNDYQKLPQFTGQYRGEYEPFALEPILLGQYSYFDTDDNRVKGQRIYGEAGVTYPMLWQFGFLKPTAKYRYLEYELTDLGSPGANDSPSTGTPLFSLDGGLYFERQTTLLDRGLLQTLEPRLYYLYSEYEDQSEQPDFDSAELTFTYNQLFRETRFSGRDRLDDADQLSVGMTTRYISEEDGREHLNASIGQIFYFRDRQVRLLSGAEPLDQSSSEMAGEVNFYPNERLTVRGSLVWDPHSTDMNAGNVQASYERDDSSIFSVGYSYRRPLTTIQTENRNQQVTEQAHFSAYVPLGNRWSLFGAVNYSVEAGESVEDMFGVEYDTCCWQVRLLHLRYYDSVTGETLDFNDPNLEQESSTQVQIVLKGMGGFGSRVTGLMEDMIRGYREREY